MGGIFVIKKEEAKFMVQEAVRKMFAAKNFFSQKSSRKIYSHDDISRWVGEEIEFSAFQNQNGDIRLTFFALFSILEEMSCSVEVTSFYFGSVLFVINSAAYSLTWGVSIRHAAAVGYRLRENCQSSQVSEGGRKVVRTLSEKYLKPAIKKSFCGPR